MGTQVRRQEDLNGQKEEGIFKICIAGVGVVVHIMTLWSIQTKKSCKMVCS